MAEVTSHIREQKRAHFNSIKLPPDGWKAQLPCNPRYKNRVMLSSVLAMKLELKICFQNQVSGNKDSLIFWVGREDGGVWIPSRFSKQLGCLEIFRISPIRNTFTFRLDFPVPKSIGIEETPPKIY